MPARHHIVVIGAGYAGVMAANRLTGRADTAITLINPRPDFVERVRLHQLATGTGTATIPLDSLLADRVDLRIDTAMTLDRENRAVHLASGARVPYDYLVLAAGSGIAASVPGAADYAHTVADLESAEHARTALAGLSPDQPVIVVGTGHTGVETATELAAHGHRAVTLLGEAPPAAHLRERARAAVQKRLTRLGIDVRVPARVIEVRPDVVIMNDGARLPSEVTVWAAGFAAPGILRSGGLRADASGRLLTDETLTSVSDPRIVVAGDAATGWRMSCQAAIPLGAGAADTVLSRLAGREPDRVAPRYVSQNVGLGGGVALVQATRADDTPAGLYLTGRAAGSIKELVCRATVRFLRTEGARPGSYRWPSQRAVGERPAANRVG